MINLLGLIEMYNTYNTQTVYHDVAACLLTHFDKLEKMTAAEIADLCNISPSTLQRFFKKMNYPMTVSKLPEIFNHTKMAYYYESAYMPADGNSGDTLSDYIGHLTLNLDQLKRSIDQAQIDRVATSLTQASQVIFLGCPIPQEAWRLQVDLVMHMCQTKAFLSPNDQFEALESLEDGSVLFYFDYFKSLANHYENAIRQNLKDTCQLIVISNTSQPQMKGNVHLCFDGNGTEQDFISFNILMNIIGQRFKEIHSRQG